MPNTDDVLHGSTLVFNTQLNATQQVPPSFQSMRVIHISDLHFTSSNHTLGQITDGILHRDYQDSAAKTNLLLSFFSTNKANFGTNVVVISGDLTDSGDDGDYTHPQRGILQFISKLKAAGFVVYVVPGNHDYCKEGNQFIGTSTPVTDGETDRRQRFINYVTPQYQHSPKYPHVEDIKDATGSVRARLVLLDSMQEELDGNTCNNRAQGTLGKVQLDALAHLLSQYQADRAAGAKVLVVLHHSPFHGPGETELSDRAALLSIVQNKIDCLLFGHVTPDGIYQMPQYSAPRIPAGKSEGLVNAEVSYGVPLINCENIEYMGSTFPISVLDLDARSRTVYYARPYTLSLVKVVCNEPATSFGDDLEIFVDNNPLSPAKLMDVNVDDPSVGKEVVKVVYAFGDSVQQILRNVVAGPRDEINIDKGQTHDFNMEFGIATQAVISFREDSDPAGQFVVNAPQLAGKGIQKQAVKIKNDGRYDIYFSIRENVTERSFSAIGPTDPRDHRGSAIQTSPPVTAVPAVGGRDHRNP